VHGFDLFSEVIRKIILERWREIPDDIFYPEAPIRVRTESMLRLFHYELMGDGRLIGEVSMS
jgi:hypothetical protein